MTQEFTTELDGPGGDIEAAIEAGRQTAETHVLQPGGYYAIATRRGVQQIDLTNLNLDRPRRTTRHTRVRDITSFVTYFGKFGRPESEVYADRQRLAVHAIIDAPAHDQPAWCDHLLTLQLEQTPTWLEWLKADRSYLPQAAFAEFIEDHLADITNPPGAEMLEVAQTLHAHTKVSFSSGYRIQDGQRRLSYVEDSSGSAGVRGELAIPTHFQLGLEVFKGDGLAEQLTARLRYRIRDGQLHLGYVLDRPEQAIDGSFAAYVEAVGTELDRPVLAGTPDICS